MKKSLLLALAASSMMVLAGCGSTHSAATSTEGTSAETATATSESTSTATSTSSSTDTTPVDPEAAYQVSSQEFTQIFLTGLASSHITASTESKSGAAYATPYDFGDAYSVYTTRSGGTPLYLYLTPEKMLSVVKMDVSGGDITYENSDLQDLSGEGFASAYEVVRANLLESLLPFAFPNKTAGVIGIGFSVDYSTEETSDILTTLYKSLTYDMATHSYLIADQDYLIYSMSVHVSGGSFHFLNKKPVSVGYSVSYKTSAFDENITFDKVGTNTFDLPTEAANLLKVYRLRYYAEDETTLLETEYVPYGREATMYDRLVKPATTSAFAYKEEGTCLVGQWYFLNASFYTSITANHDIYGVWDTVEAANYLTYKDPNQIQLKQSAGVRDVIIPDTYLYNGTNMPIYTVILPPYPGDLEHVTLNAHCTTLHRSFYNFVEYSVDPRNKIFTVVDGMLIQLQNGCDEVVLCYADAQERKTVTVPSFVTAIGEEAFSETYYLRQVDLSQTSLTDIGDYAFANSESLENVILPTTLTNLGYEAFESDDNIETVDLSVCPGLTTLKNGTFFSCDSLTSVRLPRYLETIQSGVFSQDRSLKDIVLPKGLKSLGASAFTNCSSLTSIVLPNVADILSEDEIFSGCLKLSDVTLPTNCEALGDSLFEGCQDLATLNLPSSLKKIGESTFKNSGIVSFTAPANLEEMGNNAFQGDTALTTVDLSLATQFLTIGSNSFQGCTALANVNLGSAVKTLEAASFAGCTALKSIAIPASVISIGIGVFAGDLDLTGTIDAANTSYVIKDGFLYDLAEETLYAPIGSPTTLVAPATLTLVYDGALKGLASLTSVDFSAITGELTVGVESFSGCPSLASIVWNSVSGSKVRLGTKAFYDCDALTTLTIPAGVTAFGAGKAFGGCDGLTSVDLSASAMPLDEGTFTADPNIATLKLPEDATVTSIAASEFTGDTKLTSLIVPANITTVAAKAFDGTGITMLYLKDATIPAGFATGWNTVGTATAEALLYSETAPAAGTQRYWHYNLDGSQTIIWPNT